MAATWIDVNSNYGITVAGGELALDVIAVKNSIENILSTPIGSRPFQRDYGSKLYHFLFEPGDAMTEEDIRVSLIQALGKWEPRITVDAQRTVVKQQGSAGYVIDVHFTMVVPQTRESVQFVAKRI